MFRVGQKVVCVDDRPGFASGEPVQLVKGRVYTIVRESINRTYGVDPATDINYSPIRFRPLSERKTDISIFTKMLTPKKRRVQERA